MQLADKTAIVTGASRGIGSATARLLASEGAKVAINYLQNQDRARRVKELIEADGGTAELFQAEIVEKGHPIHEFHADRVIVHEARSRGLARADAPALFVSSFKDRCPHPGSLQVGAEAEPLDSASDHDRIVFLLDHLSVSF